MSDRLIFHIDVNSAFLSWESVRRVENGEQDLRLIPAVIGGNPQKRTGIVLAKSIPAKKYGIKTGEPMAMALRKCPYLISAPADFRQYDKCSKAFKAICKSYAPAMESFSIDEVFLDMTGTSFIYPDPIATAHKIKDQIKEELGFTVNVGIGPNKLCAKMASDFEKPDKVHTLFIEEIPKKMWPLPIGELFSVGRSSAEKLQKEGITTIGQLANANLGYVQGILGSKFGKHVHNYANGIDDDPVIEEREREKSYSVETTVEENLEDYESIDRMLLAQADIVSARIRRDHVKSSCIAVTYRTTSFKNKNHQRKLDHSTDVTMEIYEVAKELIRECWNRQPLRLIGLSLSEIDDGSFEQLSFFKDEKKEKLRRLDMALDNIRGRYGNASVQRVSTMDTLKKVGRKHQAKHENEVSEKNKKN
ncbi:MAG: DNA polymerase IV [Eubacteriales bacterium]|nr:DNA polymerase IV [Eubacteriales bacterium]